MNNKRVAIFGGTSGIGEATARLASSQGAKVVIVGRNPERLEAALSRLPDASGKTADGTDPEAVARVFEGAPPFDHVVVCVSGGKGAGAFRELDLQAVRDAFAAKTLAQLTVIQVAARSMKSGSITLVTAASACSTIRGTAGLAAVNGALEAVVPILALELAPIRVNAVSPGIVDTPWWDGMPREQKDGFFGQASAALPVGRVGNPDEIGRAIVFLMTSGFTTGSTLVVDGGGRLAMH